MAYATPQDVEDRLGRPLDTDEEAQVAVLLEDAEAILLARIPDLEDQIEDGKIAERLVIMIEVNMVLRVLRNPEAFVSETDGNYSYTRSSGGAAGYLDVLPREWGWLLGGNDFYQLVPVPPDAQYGEGYTRQPNAHDWAGRAEWWPVRIP